MSTQVKTLDIVSIINELHARGHRCDYKAIESRCHGCEIHEIVAAMTALYTCKAIVLYKGEYFAVPQEG